MGTCLALDVSVYFAMTNTLLSGVFLLDARHLMPSFCDLFLAWVSVCFATRKVYSDAIGFRDDAVAAYAIALPAFWC